MADIFQDPRIPELIATFCKLVNLAAEIGAPQLEPEPEEENLYSRAEAAKFCHVSVATFDRAKKAGQIKPTATVKGRHKYAESHLLKLRDRLAD